MRPSLNKDGGLIGLTFHGSNKLRLITAGAEAVIYEGLFLKLPSVFKVRISKPYRDRRFDSLIRKERTLSEARIIIAARKSGVHAPAIYYINADEAIIVMEKIEGLLLRDILDKLTDSERCRIFIDLGKNVGILHKAGIVHGDLTTSNIVIKDNNVYLVDFGLAKYSNEIEDIGVDLHLLLRAIESTHYEYKDVLFSCFLEGYRKVIGEAELELVLNKVKEIRMRGRYIEERRNRGV
jgi:TP53 regulating kinase-like protein